MTDDAWAALLAAHGLTPGSQIPDLDQVRDGALLDVNCPTCRRRVRARIDWGPRPEQAFPSRRSVPVSGPPRRSSGTERHATASRAATAILGRLAAPRESHRGNYGDGIRP